MIAGMKLLLLILFATPAFACVDLTGEYRACEKVVDGKATATRKTFSIRSEGNEYIINGSVIQASDRKSKLGFSCDSAKLSAVVYEDETEWKLTYYKLGGKLFLHKKSGELNELFICE